MTMPGTTGGAGNSISPRERATAEAELNGYLNSESNPLLDLVQKRYRYSRESKVLLLETWATCLAFMAGEQWRSWDDRQKRLVKPTRIPSWRVLPVYNQIPGLVDVAASKLSRARQLPRARPDDSDDPEDQARAQKGTQALHGWWHGEDMELLEHEANVTRILLGCGFLHLYWDPSRMAKIPVPDLATGKVTGQYAPVGQLCAEVLTPFDVFPEPCENWRDISWCIVARKRPLSWFRSVFGEAGAGVEAETGDTENVFNSLVPGTESSGGTGSAPDGEGQATAKTMYEKPCREYPQGRMVIVAGDRVLFQRDALPLPFLGLKNPLPVKMLGYRHLPKRLWPMGLIEGCISPQRELNRGLGNMAEMIRLHRGPKWLVDKASKVDAKSITSAPDEVIEYAANSTPPQAVAPPSIPQWIVQYSDQQREEMRHLAGQQEVSEGGVPTGVSAASAIQLLQQADNTRMNSPALLGKVGLEDFAKHVLTVLAERWREPRMVAVPGKSSKQTTATISGDEIGPLEVIVELAEGVEDNDAIRQQQLSEWLGMGLMDMVAGPMGPILLQMLQEVGLGWLAEIVERELPQIQQQQALQAQEQQAQQAAAAAGQAQEGQAAQQQAQQAAQESEAQDAEAQREHERGLADQKAQVELAKHLMRPGAPAR